jgi:hypothetical protein
MVAEDRSILDTSIARDARAAPQSRAHVAQLAEHVLGKDEVSGSNPDVGSSHPQAPADHDDLTAKARWM